MPFRDASMGLCSYINCNVKECIYSIYNAVQWQFLQFDKFKVDEYEHYERVECGDLNILIPNKFLAFAGPYFKEFDEEGYPALTPDFYLPIWRKFKVSTIIRLNKKCYDKRIFTKAGYEHHDMYFIDGTTPSDAIIAKFNEICENAKGVLAVHCKAGLGRTGSCIACYMMKHYAWTAAQCICWLRICRPGSVIGPQQRFLETQQPKMWKAGDLYRQKHQKVLKYDQRAVKFSYDLNSNKNKNKNINPNVDNMKAEISEQKDDMVLPTDPGQNQGSALKHAKAEKQKDSFGHYDDVNMNNNEDQPWRVKNNHNHNNGNSPMY